MGNRTKTPPTIPSAVPPLTCLTDYSYSERTEEEEHCWLTSCSQPSPPPHNYVQRCMPFLLAIPSKSHRSRFRLYLYYTVLISLSLSLLILILLPQEFSYIFRHHNSSVVAEEVYFSYSFSNKKKGRTLKDALTKML